MSKAKVKPGVLPTPPNFNRDYSSDNLGSTNYTDNFRAARSMKTKQPAHVSNLAYYDSKSADWNRGHAEAFKNRAKKKCVEVKPVMAVDEFCLACQQSGYCNVSTAEEWCGKTGRLTFTPDDFISVVHETGVWSFDDDGYSPYIYDRYDENENHPAEGAYQ